MGTSPLAVAALLAIQASLREGECCGLRWKDVELERNALHVRQSVAEARAAPT